jgi:hypothetical protein
MSRGDSQSGNSIGSFIHLGFDQDENGKIVWDGATPHIAARQLALNFRFAVAGGAAGPYQAGSECVLWWSDYADNVRHRPTAGMLDRCRASNTCPKIMETFGALEFWYLRESPNLVGTDAKSGIPLPPNVRRYFFLGTSHGGGRGGFSVTTPAPPNGCALPANPNPESDTMAALRVAMVDWISRGIEPPPSRFPTLAQGQLAPATKAGIGFPSIPGVPSPDGLVNVLGKAAEPILEKYLKLRYQLMPYIYSLGYRTNESGAPYMRALFMDFPDDPNVAGLGDEYMFGPAFLVAPVTEQGATSRSVYLPAGADWYNYWTNQRIRGGQTIKVDAPIDTLPLFVRAGSILPLGEPVQSTSETQKIARVRVYPGADGDFTLYDDDGKTYAYESGDRRITRLHWNDGAGRLSHEGSQPWTGSDAGILEVVGR